MKSLVCMNQNGDLEIWELYMRECVWRVEPSFAGGIATIVPFYGTTPLTVLLSYERVLIGEL